jgi:hypothetical protein
MNGISELREAAEIIAMGLPQDHIRECLEGTEIVLGQMKQTPTGWKVAPAVAHIIGENDPGLAYERLDESRRILRLVLAAQGAEV